MQSCMEKQVIDCLGMNKYARQHYIKQFMIMKHAVNSDKCTRHEQIEILV